MSRKQDTRATVYSSPAFRPRMYGLEGAKIHADMYAKRCYMLLDGIDGNTAFLYDLITYVRNRSK